MQDLPPSASDRVVTTLTLFEIYRAEFDRVSKLCKSAEVVQKVQKLRTPVQKLCISVSKLCTRVQKLCSLTHGLLPTRRRHMEQVIEEVDPCVFVQAVA